MLGVELSGYTYAFLVFLGKHTRDALYRRKNTYCYTAYLLTWNFIGNTKKHIQLIYIVWSKHIRVQYSVENTSVLLSFF